MQIVSFRSWTISIGGLRWWGKSTQVLLVYMNEQLKIVLKWFCFGGRLHNACFTLGVWNIDFEENSFHFSWPNSNWIDGQTWWTIVQKPWFKLFFFSFFFFTWKAKTFLRNMFYHFYNVDLACIHYPSQPPFLSPITFTDITSSMFTTFY